MRVRPIPAVSVAVLLALAATARQPAAQQPTAALYGIGVLDGPGNAENSAVRDATRVDGTIYAVGASAFNANRFSATNPDSNLDAPVLWTRDGGGSVALQALPNIPNPWTNSTSAMAITPNADYVASTVRISASGNSGTNWVRVDRNAGTNLLLNAPASSGGCGFGGFSALSISDNGGVVYGQASNGVGGWRVVRCEIGLGGNLPDLTPTNRNWGTPTPRGTSSDGSVMVGIAAINNVNNDPFPAAFRYVHNAGTLTGTTTLIPKLRNAELVEGTWNMPVAIGADGNQTVVIGDSPDYPNGAVYLTNAANEITAVLGSPNTALRPRPLGGITADGSVVAVTFSNPTPGTAGASLQGPTPEVGIPPGGRHAYIHNSHGWFHLSSILASQGIDLTASGWDPANFAITGIRTVDGVDLVFGQGRRRTVGPTGYVIAGLDGFVAVLPAGVLAAFNPQPIPPTDLSLVGTWYAGDPLTTTVIISHLADGTFFRISSTGFERGLYTWAGNASGGAFTYTTLYDTDGNLGASPRNGQVGLSAIVSGNTATFTDANCPTCNFIPNTRITGGAGSLDGGWIVGAIADLDGAMIVALDAGSVSRVLSAFDNPGTQGDFTDIGTYTWDPLTSTLVFTPDGGGPNDSNTVVLSRDERYLDVVEDEGVLRFTRIIDPRTPSVASALAATATTGLPFAYQIAATNSPSTFGAANLPAGLSVDSATGLVSGTPTAAGIFDVLLEAANTLSTSTGRNHLTLTVIAPVAITELGPAVVTPIAPEEGEVAPVTISFTNVTGAGEVSVATIDPATVLAAPDPPAGFSLGDNPVYYEISSTVTFDGPVQVCFSYAGIGFSGVPRLLHYDEALATWVDITTSVTEATTTVCGLTSSFSPFAVAGSALAGVGFHAPVEPVAGAVNVVNGGRTVPLKFNVYGSDGTEITSPGDIDNLAFRMAQVACEAGTAEEWVEIVTTGNTSLRYDAAGGHFIQNWKTPKATGCYLVRVTGDGLLLSARFRLR